MTLNDMSILQNNEKTDIKLSNQTSYQTNDGLQQGSTPSGNSIRKKLFLYILFTFGVFCMCLSIAANQFLQGSMGIFQSCTFRFGALALISLPFVLINHRNKLLIEREHLPQFIGTMLFVLAFNYTYYYATTFVPAGEAASANTALSLVIASLLTLCIKSERKWPLYISTLLAVTGTVLLAQPRSLFSEIHLREELKIATWNSSCKLDGYRPRKSDRKMAYCLLAISAATLVGSFRFLRTSSQNIPPFVLSFYQGVISTVISAVLSFLTETIYTPNAIFCIFMVTLSTVGVAIYLSILFSCLAIIEVPIMLILKSIDQVILVIFQFTFLHEILPAHFNIYAVFGIIVCITGTLLNPVVQLYQENKGM